MIRDDSSGKRQTFSFTEENIVFRSQVSAESIVASKPGQKPEATQALEFLHLASQNPILYVALATWSAPNPDWGRLYRILEEIERFLGHSVVPKLCSANARERFTRTANAAEVSGVDARHRLGKFEPPGNPMTLHEAVDFIRQLLLSALAEERNHGGPQTVI